MFLPIVAAAALILGDGYEPAGEVAWLCPQPEAAGEIALKVEHRAAPGLISALARARKCVSWENGTLNVSEARRLGGQDIGLIRISVGGTEVSYWVSGNTVRWTRHGRRVGVEY